MDQPKVCSVLVAALGGEGGGVLADWLVGCARQAGLAVQATSVPGVAQRTGATSYYIEFVVQPLAAHQPAPVFALSPMPAQVDAVVASELLEAARMMERGFVTPQKTCLIASTSRVYTTHEKMAMGDGRFDSQRMIDLARSLAQRAVLLDMATLTQTHRTVVSAIMFGAMAGAGVLPWSRAVCEDIIRASGKGVAASLAGFAAAFEQALGVSRSTQAVSQSTEGVSQHSLHHDAQQAMAELSLSPMWAQHIAQLPSCVHSLAAHGVARCLDYQDQAYAQAYVQHLTTLANAVDTSASALLPTSPTAQALQMAARHLALWMCYEDVIRVADLKTRPERFARVRAHANAQASDVVRVVEHFKPGLDEVAAVLPQALGLRLQAWSQRRSGAALHVSMHIRSTSIWGYLMLRALARLRPWRRTSLRYAQEHATLNLWWQAMCQLLPSAPEFAEVLAEMPQVLKGYGDTQLRGRLNFDRLWQAHVLPALSEQLPSAQSTAQFKQALADTLADPEEKLNKSFQGKPVLWLKQNQPV